MVYLKDTYADPATRTYLISLLVRNRIIEVGVPEGIAREEFPTGRNLWTLERPEQEREGNYYIDVDAIQQDADGHYVWQAANLTVDDLYGTFDPVLTVRKVRVTPGDRRRSYVVYTYRELTDLGGLDPASDIVVGGIEGEPEDGGELLLVRQRWLLRPGDLAEVDLGMAPEPGLFVPEGTIQFDGAENFVWLARPTGSDHHEVVRVRVNPGRVVGSLQRIEPMEEGLLPPGAKVVVDGAHYVTAGEEVNLIEEVSLDR
jgi:multidrug efflux pump subunit AcrA (membrane-fusion protein)